MAPAAAALAAAMAVGDGSGDEERRENTPSLLSASFSSFATVNDVLSD